MDRVFPHLSDDAFPHLETVDPYKRKVPFDYKRYDYQATIKLCCVPWPSDYKHVVNWRAAAARDAYFAGLTDHVIELDQGFLRTQTDSVRVPVPYDEALTYNYVYMVVPPITQDERIAYEGDTGLRVVCAWIQDAIYYAPSATELILSVDVWTTYLPHLAPTSMMLHRGHAPAYATSVETYLANPRENCANLLTPDVSYGDADVTAHAHLVDIAQGEKMIVLASTIPYGVIAGLTLSQAVSEDVTDPTYYDTGARNGHQVGVNGYGWHYGGREYAGMRNPSAYGAVGNTMPTYTYLYALESDGARTALANLSTRLPQFVTSIQAAYILPRRALTLASSTYEVAGTTLYRVMPSVGVRDLDGIKPAKADFGYPTRYADIAKLYTSPYARLVVSDTLGNDVRVRIEDMGANPRLAEQLSPMAECLRWDMLLRGVSDAGATTYQWVTLDGSTTSMSLPGADLARYTIPLDIPTYALYLDGRTAHAMTSYADAQGQRLSAINAYQATMRSANNSLENTHDSADAAKANADASADAAKANADASADANVTNTENSGRNAQANAAIANNTRTTSTARSNTAANELRDASNDHIFNSLYADDEYTMQASDVNLKSESVAGALSTVGALASGNLIGAVSNGLSGIVNITTSAALSQLSSENIEVKEAIGQDYQTNTTAIQVSNNSDQASYANTANTNTTNNNVDTANANASNSARTAKANATRTQGVTKADATRTQGVTKANATATRGTGETNAKAALVLAQQVYAQQGHAHDLDNPQAYGMASGDTTPDALMRRVIQVRLETQSKSAIARAGDVMLRYGYIFDGLWSVTDWCPSAHDGCYWEASDVLVRASAIDNPTAERTYEAILMQGTTVWNDPAKIGGIPW